MTKRQRLEISGNNNSFWSFIKKFIKKLDKILLFSVIAVTAFSILMLYSMNVNEIGNVYGSTIKTQVLAACIGIFAAIVIALIDYHLIARLWFIYTPIVIGLVILTFFIGIEVEGAEDRAWLDFGFTTMQPSELLKIAFIITFAYHVSKTEKNLNHPLNILALCAHGALPIIMIIKQNDYGTALVFVMIFLTMIFSAGISWMYILSALIIAPFAGYFIWTYVFDQMHRNRILILFNPGTDPLGLEYQQDLGLAALGSGQLFGRGLFAAEGDTFRSVPEMKNDFIFTHVGQTFGYIGSLALIVVLVFIMLKILANSHVCKDTLGRLICCGAFALLVSHTILNIGMVLKVMPVIGVPLPFMSAGGSALISMYGLIGLVLSTNFHNEKKYRFFYDPEKK